MKWNYDDFATIFGKHIGHSLLATNKRRGPYAIVVLFECAAASRKAGMSRV